MKPLLIVLGVTYIFYLLFLVYAAAAPKWSTLPIWPKLLLLPIGVVFYVLDVCFNVIIGSLLFLQLPTMKTSTLTKRMAANKSVAYGWRKTLATWICGNLLDPFAQGHC